MTLAKFSSLIRMINMSAVTPALGTNTSTGPWCSSTAVNAASTAALSVTSHSTGNRSSSGAPDPRCVTATLCPSAASRRATASPMPRFPPVTEHRTGNEGWTATGGLALGIGWIVGHGCLLLLASADMSLLLTCADVSCSSQSAVITANLMPEERS